MSLFAKTRVLLSPFDGGILHADQGTPDIGYDRSIESVLSLQEDMDLFYFAKTFGPIKW